MMEISGKRETATDAETAGVQCDPCLLMNKSANADHYCVDCDEFFCNNCSPVHKMSKLSRNHNFLSRDKMPRQKLTSTEERVCSKHIGEALKYFCKDHKNFYCPVCVIIAHKNCSVEYIDDIAADFETSSEYISLKEKISRLLQDLKDLQKTSTRNIQDLQIVFSKFEADLKTFRSTINHILDSMEEETLIAALVMEECDMQNVQTVSEVCDTMITDVTDIINNLENYEHYKQQRQLVIAAKKAETKISEFEKKKVKLCSQNKIRKYEFRQNEEVLRSLSSVGKLGKIR